MLASVAPTSIVLTSIVLSRIVPTSRIMNPNGSSGQEELAGFN